MSDISKFKDLSGNLHNIKDAIHRSDKNNPHEVTAKQIGAKSLEADYRISGAAGWYKFLVVPVEVNKTRKIVLSLVESYNTTGVAVIAIYLNRRSDGTWASTNGYIISSTVINNTDFGFVLNEQDNEVEFYYNKRSNVYGYTMVNVLESVSRDGVLIDLSEQFESTSVSEFPSTGTYFRPSQDGAGNFIPTTYATKEELGNLENGIAPTEATSTASTNYAVGECLFLDGVLYKVTAAIASGETIAPGTNVTPTTMTDITDELNTRTTALESALDGLVSRLGAM